VVATISGFPSATLLSLVKMGVRPLVADSVELGVMRPAPSAPPARRLRSEFTWWRLRSFTRQLLKDIDVVTVTSEAERALFADLVREPDQCVVVPSALDLHDYEGDYGPRDLQSLLYAGSFSYVANYEAMLWFTREVFPLIEAGAQLTIQVTGNTAGRDLSPLRNACPQIEFTGFVDDIRPYFAQSGICIVPVLSGGSTRLKIIEAMAWGTPVVSTRIGAEGLAVISGENILLADSAQGFAAEIDRLVGDSELWHRLSAGGLRLVADCYTADHLRRQLATILASVVDQRQSGSVA
jgi:glycosyltransferase involved in cell wall biosynthesis